jgi:hypothetical protein
MDLTVPVINSVIKARKVNTSAMNSILQTISEFVNRGTFHNQVTLRHSFSVVANWFSRSGCLGVMT